MVLILIVCQPKTNAQGNYSEIAGSVQSDYREIDPATELNKTLPDEMSKSGYWLLSGLFVFFLVLFILLKYFKNVFKMEDEA